VLGEFIPVSYHEEDLDFAKEQEISRDNLKRNIEKHAWDGDWYLRAFYDDQKKLGSKESDECKIDSISQSWSVISGGAEKERALKAIDSAQRYLVNEKDWISLLLTPPFDKTENNPGYIKNYYPGVRENGGQYSHASVWLAMAASLLGDYDLSQTLFTMLNPIKITSTRKDALRYEKEPYVMTADIMAVDGSQTGRGGWSWYTGSAGWMYQGLIKNFIGISKEGTSLIINPSVPANFGPYTIWYKYGASKYEIQITSSLEKNQNVKEFIIDDVKIEGNKIELVGDGKYHLVIV
jgi:cellobiose phosphorylase